MPTDLVHAALPSKQIIILQHLLVSVLCTGKPQQPDVCVHVYTCVCTLLGQGKTYSIWKLSDLQEADTTVSFFLFGQVYKQLWKVDVGCVIGLLNPSIMDPIEKVFSQ